MHFVIFHERTKNMKRVISVLLSLMMIAGLLNCTVISSSAASDEWSGTFNFSDFTGDTANIASDCFGATDGTATVESIRTFDMRDGFSLSAKLTMKNSTATYLGEYCSMKAGNIELRITNIAGSDTYNAELYANAERIATAPLSSAPNGKYRLFVNKNEIWVMLNNTFIKFTDNNGNSKEYIARPENALTADSKLSFTVSGNGSGAKNRCWDSFLLLAREATKYDSKTVYLRLVSYDAAEENAYFAVPDRTVIYTGDKITLNYSAYTAFTWPNGKKQTEWNMRADNGQTGQPANGYKFSFDEAGTHSITASSVGFKLITFEVVDRFYAPTSAKEEASTDTVYPDGSSLPFTDKLVTGDAADLYNNPVDSGVYFTSDIWQAVPLISQDLIDAGYSGGEGCQLVNNISYGNDGKLAFLGTDVGGIYKSVDGGANWYPCTVGFVANGATSIVVDPKNNNKVLCVGASSSYDDSNGILMSTDAGESWSLVFNGSQMEGSVGWHGDMRIQIAYDETSYDADLGYCKTVYWSRENNTNSSANNHPAIYKSTDGGYTWAELPNTTSYGGKQIRVSSDTGWVYVNNNDGIYRSKDGGSNWEQVLNQYVAGFDMVSTHPSNLYATNENGMIVSSDYGDTWETFKGNNFPDSGYSIYFTVSPTDPDNIMLQQYYDTYKYICYYSNDGGHTWDSININRTGHWNGTSGASYHSFAWNPVHKNTVITSGWGGVYKSINGGSDFFWSNAGFNSICGGGSVNFSVNNPEILSTASQDFNGGYTTDSGKTWSYINWAGNAWGGFTYGSYAIDENTIITGVSSKMYGTPVLCYTHDGGKTITNTGLSITGKQIGCGALNNNNIAFLGEYRTTNGGYTFTKMDGCTGVFTVDRVTGRLFGVNGSAIVTSTDNGATWSTVSTQFSDVSDIAYSSSTGKLYVVAKSALYVGTPDYSSSTNSFTVCHFTASSSANCVAVDPNNNQVVYVGCSSPAYHDIKAIWRSLDGGNSWTCLTRSAGDGRESADGGKQPIAIRVSPVTGELFVVTGCRGIWKIAAPPQWYLESRIETRPAPVAMLDRICNDIAENAPEYISNFSKSSAQYIYTKSDFNNIRYNLGGFYILMNDIEFTEADFLPGGAFYNSGNGWTPFLKEHKIGSPFSGVFYGNGHVIRGLKCFNNCDFQSIFGRVDGLVMRTGFEDCVIGSNAGTLYSSVIAAQSYGVIVDCYIKDCVINTSSGHIGSFVGFNCGTIRNCYTTCTYTGSKASSAYPFVAWDAGSSSDTQNTGLYYLDSTTNNQKSGNRIIPTALSAEQMKQENSFVGFDFENTWEFKTGDNSPTLRTFVEEIDPSVGMTASINVTNANLRIGSRMLTAVTLTDADGNSVTPETYFYTTTPDIVEVNQEGRITALKGGTGYVYVTEMTSGKIMRVTLNVSLATLPGDVNCDKKIDSMDILSMQQMILGLAQLSDQGKYNADITNDGFLTADDLLALQQYILGTIDID